MRGEVRPLILFLFLFLALNLRKFQSEKQNENEVWRRANLFMRSANAHLLRSGTELLQCNNDLGFARSTDAVAERSRGRTYEVGTRCPSEAEDRCALETVFGEPVTPRIRSGTTHRLRSGTGLLARDNDLGSARSMKAVPERSRGQCAQVKIKSTC